mmetsp:Transcript_2357/g.4819  ORF Transcript_2357/g.4819 Transcript_2357/m.4819 type:complete len:276 (-) Transcript_2357:327-1154(-)
MIVQAWVRSQQPMLLAFVQTQTRLSNIFQVTQCKGKCGEFLIHFRQQGAGRFDFQEILSFHVSLVNGNAQILWTSITVARTHGHIHRVNFVLFKFTIRQLFTAFNFFRGRFSERNFLDTIQNISFHLMHSSRLNRFHTICLSYSLNGLGDVRVLGSRRNGLGSHQHGIVGAHSHLAHFVVGCDLLAFGTRHNQGVRRNRNVSVNVTTQIDFDHVPRLERFSFFAVQGRIIAYNIIDGNANGKGHTSFHNLLAIDLFVVNLLRRRVDDRVAKFAQI